MSVAQTATIEERAPLTLQDSLKGGSFGAFEARSAFAACLMPLLEALRWRGDPVAIAEALPHFSNTLDLVGLRNTLANLGYVTTPHAVPLRSLDPRLAPCLYVQEDGAPLVVLVVHGETAQVYDGGSRSVSEIASHDISGTAYFLVTNRPEQNNDNPNDSWLRATARRFRRLIQQLLVLTFLLNVLALAVPVFVMLVYDRVIGTSSLTTLLHLGIGIAFVLAFDVAFRAIRSRMLSYIGARLDLIAGTSAYRQIVSLPAAMTESAPVGSQVGRIKQFERMREFFTGPIALVYLELPFVPLSIAVIAALGGPLAVIPIILVGLFALVGVLMAPRVRDATTRASRTGAERQAVLVETLSNMRAIKTTGGEDVWRQRYRENSSQAAMHGYEIGRLSAELQTIAHVLMIAAGAATLAFGALMVLDGAISVGALIAIMMLIWRALGPLQTGFLSLTKLTQVRSAVRQMNELLRLPVERQTDRPRLSQKHFAGRVTFARASLRYRADVEPALIGVTFDIKPGELVGIIGANGSGKSSILKLILGLYTAQAGTVLIDGLDVRQLDPTDLRRGIAYVPQMTHLFYGTIAQNLRFADPLASDDALHAAAAQAGVLDDIMALPDGFGTRFGDQQLRTLPSGFLKRVALARAYLKDAPILLFDEPADSLDENGNEAFVTMLDKMRGERTAFFVTHRRSHLRLADRLLVLENGALIADGAPGDVLKQQAGDLV